MIWFYTIHLFSQQLLERKHLVNTCHVPSLGFENTKISDLDSCPGRAQPHERGNLNK